MGPSIEGVNVGGLLCKVYNKREAVERDLPIAVLLAAHGRGEDQDALKRLVEGVIATCDEAAKAGKAEAALIVVTMVRGKGLSPVKPKLIILPLRRTNAIMAPG